MVKQYILQPKYKYLSELRGMEAISLLFPDEHFLEKIEIEKVLINSQTQDVTLYLKTPVAFDDQLRAKIEAQLSVDLEAKCQIRLLTEKVDASSSGLEQSSSDLDQLAETIKKQFAGVYAWLTSTPLAWGGEETLVLRVNSALALDYIRPRESQLVNCLQEMTGKRIKLRYEVVEEERPVLELPEEYPLAEEILQPTASPTGTQYCWGGPPWRQDPGRSRYD